MLYPIKRLFVAIILSVAFIQSSLAQQSDKVMAVVLGKPVLERDVAPTDEQLSVLARAMGVSKEMAVAQFQQAKLTEMIVDDILDDYAVQKQIDVDPELVKRFLDVFGEILDNTPDMPEKVEVDDDLVISFEPMTKRAPREVAEEQVKHWQVEKAMYEEFGGSVVFRSNVPQYPVAAYNALLKQYEKQGKLKIRQGAFSAVFWRSFAPPYSAEIDPANVDFSHPWWY